MTIYEESILTGMCPQTIRRLHKSLRIKGWWVCGGDDGMYLADDFDTMAGEAGKLMLIADGLHKQVEGMLKAEKQTPTSAEAKILALLPKKASPLLETPEKHFDFIEVRELLEGDSHV